MYVNMATYFNKRGSLHVGRVQCQPSWQLYTEASSLTSRRCACREKVSTALFFQYNAQLGPPYQVLVDTNFINFAIKNKVRSHLRSDVHNGFFEASA
jgi:hypothetical protein